MKTSFVRNTVWVAMMSALLSFSAPVFGDGGVDLMNQALDLVHQALNPGGDPPSNDERTDLLTQALKVLQQIPPDRPRFQGHRKMVIGDIKAALFELKKGDPDNKATGDIHDAYSELRTAIADAT